MSGLTVKEREVVRDQSVKAMRARLQERQPRLEQYQTEQSRAARMIASTLVWSKAAVPLIALLAALASSVRTVQTAAEIYTASGSHPIGVVLAAVAFTVATEGALFALALAQEGDAMKARAEKRPRKVMSLKTIWNSIAIRLGLKEPPRWDQDHSSGVGVVIWIAFGFAVSANAYMGLKPLVTQLGEGMSLQAFTASLLGADARIQLSFLVDMAGVLFPPFMALKAGHLTARFAAEISESGRAGIAAFERDMASWREANANPLSSEEGQEFFAESVAIREASKAAREAAKRGEPAPFGSTAPIVDGLESGRMTVSANGHGGGKTAVN